MGRHSWGRRPLRRVRLPRSPSAGLAGGLLVCQPAASATTAACRRRLCCAAPSMMGRGSARRRRGGGPAASGGRGVGRPGRQRHGSAMCGEGGLGGCARRRTRRVGGIRAVGACAALPPPPAVAHVVFTACKPAPRAASPLRALPAARQPWLQIESMKWQMNTEQEQCAFRPPCRRAPLPPCSAAQAARLRASGP